jgi:undecaprenyl-diphosphatase
MLSDLILGSLFGVVEGLTEFLPISSTGHLIITGQIFNFVGERAETFQIFIQLGAILAALVLYRRRFYALCPSFVSKEHTKLTGFGGFRGCFILLLACLPVFILGFFLREFIRNNLFSVYTVAWALLVGGAIMIVLEFKEERRRLMRVDNASISSERVISLDDITIGHALKIGLFQCLALWPGMSRSASTIIGGLLSGVDRKVAAEFSFIVAVPVMIIAVGYDLLKSLSFFR